MQGIPPAIMNFFVKSPLGRPSVATKYSCGEGEVGLRGEGGKLRHRGERVFNVSCWFYLSLSHLSVIYNFKFADIAVKDIFKL